MPSGGRRGPSPACLCTTGFTGSKNPAPESEFGVPPRRSSLGGCALATSPGCRRPLLEACARPLELRRGGARADRARHQGGRPLTRAGERASFGGYGGLGQARSLHERSTAHERRASPRRTRHHRPRGVPPDLRRPECPPDPRPAVGPRGPLLAREPSRPREGPARSRVPAPDKIGGCPPARHLRYPYRRGSSGTRRSYPLGPRELCGEAPLEWLPDQPDGDHGAQGRVSRDRGGGRGGRPPVQYPGGDQWSPR